MIDLNSAVEKSLPPQALSNSGYDKGTGCDILEQLFAKILLSDGVADFDCRPTTNRRNTVLFFATAFSVSYSAYGIVYRDELLLCSTSNNC